MRVLYALNWKVPILLAATAYVLTSGPLQTLIAYSNAAPELRKKRSWFLLYLLFTHLYSEYLTMLTRVAHLRQLFGVREWRITPRSDECTAPASRVINRFDVTVAGRPQEEPDEAPELEPA